MSDKHAVQATATLSTRRAPPRATPRGNDSNARDDPLILPFDVPFAIEACSSLVADMTRDALPIDHVVAVSPDAIPFTRFIVELLPGTTLVPSVSQVPPGACVLLVEAWCTARSNLPSNAALALERIARPVTAAIIVSAGAPRFPDYHALTLEGNVIPRFPWQAST